MNIYRRAFFVQCPSDGAHIWYELTIQSRVMVRVEEINRKIGNLERCTPGIFHEHIADSLYAEFGGEQIITAAHQGVFVETRRGFA